MRLFVLVAAGVAVAIGGMARAADIRLTLVSYAVAKPAFAKIIPAFVEHYKAETGDDVTFTESYGPSGAQSRAVVGGLEADVVATNLQANVDMLVAAGLVKPDWPTRLPNGASPVSSVIAIVVRKGNPKAIHDWADLTKNGVQIVAINPKTSGNARWGVLAGYAATLKTKDEAAADAYLKGLVANTKTLVSGGREATDAFLKNRVGDALLTFENEAQFANRVGRQGLEYVAPDPNVRCDFPVVVVDKVVDRRGTRKAAEAFAQYLFGEQAQTMYAETGYRPTNAAVAAKTAGDFAGVKTILGVDDVGGWKAIDAKLFADGALYDQAQRK